MATAFAVYCADDTSLTFYKRETVPTAGSVFEGKTATAVYTGIETDEYAKANNVPWKDFRSKVTSVVFADRISPVSTAAWFYNFTEIGSLDVSNLDVSGTTAMRSTFGYCWNLKTLDLSSWDTRNVTNMSGMFTSCQELITVYVSKLWSTASAATADMFLECYSLVGGNGTVCDGEVGNLSTEYARIDTPQTPGYFTYKPYVPAALRGDYIIQGETLYEIAEAIRSKTGSTDSLTPGQMAEAILGIGAS